MPEPTCERCGGESYTDLRFCGECLYLLAGEPPDDEAAAFYFTPNACVALYLDGSTRSFDGERWGERKQTWNAKHGRQMLEQKKRAPETLTAVGLRALGLELTLF